MVWGVEANMEEQEENSNNKRMEIFFYVYAPDCFGEWPWDGHDVVRETFFALLCPR